MTFRISTQDGIQLREQQVKYLQENVLVSLHKLKIRNSVQPQTVMTMHEQEIVRDRAMPSYQRLKTMVRRHTDQMIRTRTCKAWNERIETGVLVRSHNGRNVSIEMKVGEYCQWRVTGQCQKEMLQFPPRRY